MLEDFLSPMLFVLLLPLGSDSVPDPYAAPPRPRGPWGRPPITFPNLAFQGLSMDRPPAMAQGGQAGGQYYAPNVWSPQIAGLDYQRPVFQYAGGRDYESAPLLGNGNIIQRNGFSADRPVEAGQDYTAGQDHGEDYQTVGMTDRWTAWTRCDSGQKFKQRFKTEKETLSCNPPIGPNPNHKTCPKELPKVGSSCQLTQFGRKCGYQWSSCCGEYIAGKSIECNEKTGQWGPLVTSDNPCLFDIPCETSTPKPDPDPEPEPETEESEESSEEPENPE